VHGLGRRRRFILSKQAIVNLEAAGLKSQPGRIGLQSLKAPLLYQNVW
jgi:hypothetical protein